MHPAQLALGESPGPSLGLYQVLQGGLESFEIQHVLKPRALGGGEPSVSELSGTRPAIRDSGLNLATGCKMLDF